MRKKSSVHPWAPYQDTRTRYTISEQKRSIQLALEQNPTLPTTSTTSCHCVCVYHQQLCIEVLVYRPSYGVCPPQSLYYHRCWCLVALNARVLHEVKELYSVCDRHVLVVLCTFGFGLPTAKMVVQIFLVVLLMVVDRMKKSAATWIILTMFCSNFQLNNTLL